MIRVVSIISRMNVGGPAVLLAELIEGLPKGEFEHILITGRCQSNEIDFLDTHTLSSKIIYIDKIQRSVLPINDILSFFTLLRTLKALNPDIVHTHTSKAGLLGRLAARMASPNSRIIHTFHGHLLYGYFSPFKTRIVILLERFLAKITDALVAVTHQVRDDLLRVGIGLPKKWTVIRPGLRKPLPVDKSSAMRFLDIAREKFVVVWIGRFTSIKDPIAAIRSIERLPPEVLLKVQLVMAGDGELFDECNMYARSRNLPIIFLGWCTDVFPVLAAADLLLMTSKNEGMPVVVVEAALCQVPTLSTNVGGVGEFILDKKTGYLVQTGEDLTEALEEIFVNPVQLAYVASNAKKLAETEFSKEIFIENHLALYRAK